ncbi:hypothetical protein FNF29_01814 [Cafeteria roenbergensis]|uniref:DUF2064 domain-containing protein n=1 Tax=Cafeteria roenbergensis TaxID=33653 RepID=A0A5A8CRV3_CAFRO|nr:hypothetical protein FNF29_01814 [Cafeteria roenbergensis]|eukprot:KAA0155439.1 hypothetical protein FNF29_01814 [Cafeteria roenbergensis]
MSRTADEAPRSLTASLATALAAESEWARRFLGGDPDAWSAAESHCPRSRTVRISGVLGELDAFQPLAADGAVDSGLAIAQHLALSGLRAAASPCAGTLDFEYAAADRVTLVEVKRTMATLASGSARGASFPSCPAHVGAWLARAEADASDAARARSASASARPLLPPAPAAATSAGAPLAATLRADPRIASALAWTARRSLSPECVCHGSLTSAALLVAPPGSRDVGDFLPVPPHHGSADGSAAAVKAASSGVGDLIGGIGATGALVMTTDDGPALPPKTATDIAEAVEAAGRRAAGGLGHGVTAGAVSGAGGGDGGSSAEDDGSVALVGPSSEAFAGPRGFDAGTLLGSLVVAAAAAAVAEGRAAAAAAAATGYSKHIAAQRADVASRRRAEAATGCGALLAGFAGTLLRRLGPQEASLAAETACSQATAEVVRVTELHSRGDAEADMPLEVASLGTAGERAACLALAGACARLLGCGVAAAVRSVLADQGLDVAAPAAESAAIQAGLAVSQAVNAALATAKRALAVADAASADEAASALASWFSGGASAHGAPSGVPAAIGGGARGPWTLVVIAKPPVAGHAKTRLAAELAGLGCAEAARAAAGVSSALLADTLASMRHVDGDGCVDRAVYTVVPSGRAASAVPPELQSVVDAAESPASWRIAVHPEAGKRGLSEVMEAALSDAQARSAGPVAFVGCDMPTLRLVDLMPAVRAAWGGTSTMLPAGDGGYVALVVPGGASGRACFADVEWSTSHTFASQQAAVQADACVKAVRSVPGRVWDDVDTLESLKRVALLLGAGSATHHAWTACKPAATGATA